MEAPTSTITLLLLVSFLISLTRATNFGSTTFNGIVCNQCHQWSGSTPTTRVGNTRVGKAGPRGFPGFRGIPGPAGPAGPPGRRVHVDMAVIQEAVDIKMEEAFQMFSRENCQGAQSESASSRSDPRRVLELFIPAVGFKNVLCDVSDEGGNWTVFQRRMNGNVDFFLGWDDYVQGFGDLQDEFWLGLEALHQMTKEGNNEMKINMITKDGVRLFAKYSNFRVGPGSSNYRLSVSGYSGNATDAMLAHSDQQFTTKDADHDEGSSANCASTYEGAWWYEKCYNSNLNGNYTRTDSKGMTWWKNTIPKIRYVLAYSEMKFRRRFLR